MIAVVRLARAVNFSGNGELNALGQGWDVIGPSPLPGIVVLATLTTELEDDSRDIEVVLQLLNANDELVEQPNEENPSRLEIPLTLRTSPRAARPAGIPGSVTAVVELGPGLNLEAGLYRWRLLVEGRTEAGWERPFYVRAKPDEFPGTATIQSLK